MNKYNKERKKRGKKLGHELKYMIKKDYDMTIFILYPCINPRIPYQPSTLASALGLMQESRADTGISGWYEVLSENSDIIISIYWMISYIL